MKRSVDCLDVGLLHAYGGLPVTVAGKRLLNDHCAEPHDIPGYLDCRDFCQSAEYKEKIRETQTRADGSFRPASPAQKLIMQRKFGPCIFQDEF